MRYVWEKFNVKETNNVDDNNHMGTMPVSGLFAGYSNSEILYVFYRPSGSEMFLNLIASDDHTITANAGHVIASLGSSPASNIYASKYRLCGIVLGKDAIDQFESRNPDVVIGSVIEHRVTHVIFNMIYSQLYIANFISSGVTSSEYTNAYWYARGGTTSSASIGVYYGSWSISNQKWEICEAVVQTRTQKGDTSFGYATLASSSGYPSNGRQGNYWYVYQGSDNPDASCSIPASIQGGSVINITANLPGNTYGGSFGFQYAYQLDGGSWVTMNTDFVSSTTRQLGVPDGTNTVKARVLTKDDKGYLSSNWAESALVTVNNNTAPTAPGSISVSNVVGNQNTTITITAASNPDGTIANYQHEKRVDGGLWEVFSTQKALSAQCLVSSTWSNVQFRVCAIDNDGATGAYVTSAVYNVSLNSIVITGPSEALGEQDTKFELSITVSVTGADRFTGVTIEAVCHDITLFHKKNIGSTSPTVVIPINTLLMAPGEHEITVKGTHATYASGSVSYPFTVPDIDFDPDTCMYGEYHDPKTWATLLSPTSSRFVICPDGRSLSAVLIEGGIGGGGGSGGAGESYVAQALPETTTALAANTCYNFTQTVMPNSAYTFTLTPPKEGVLPYYHCFFKTGSAVPTINFTGATLPVGLSFVANRVYEITILCGYLSFQSWEVA